MNAANPKRPMIWRNHEPVRVSEALRALAELVYRRLKNSLGSGDIGLLCCIALTVIMCVVSALLPGVISFGGIYDRELLYSSLWMLYTAMFCAMSLSDNDRYSADILYFAPLPPFVTMLFRSLSSLLPFILKVGLLFVTLLGIACPMFDVGALFCLLGIAGFIVTAAMGVLTLTVLRLLEVIFGIKRSAIRLSFTAVMVLWVLLALLLTPSNGALDEKFREALLSSVGTTVPVGGWLCSIIMGICEGSLPVVIPGLLLCPSFAAVLVMLLCVMTQSQYDLASAVLIEAERSPAVLIAAENSFIKLIGGLVGLIPSGSSFCAVIYRTACDFVHRSVSRSLRTLNIAAACIIAASVMNGLLSGAEIMIILCVISIVMRLIISDDSACGIPDNFADRALCSLAFSLYGVPVSILLAAAAFVPASFIAGASAGSALIAGAVFVIVTAVSTFVRGILPYGMILTTAVISITSAAASLVISLNF